MSIQRRESLAQTAYLAIMLGLLAVRFLFWFMPNYEARVNLVYVWPCAVTAFVLGLGLSAERRYRTVWVAYALTVWLMVVNIINGDYGFEYNLKFCLGILASIGIGFPFFLLWDSKKFHRALTMIGNLYVFMLLALAFVSLYAVITRQQLALPFSERTLGIQYNRLQVFDYNPNEIASAFSVALYVSLVLLLRSKRAWVKVLYTLTALVFYIAIPLTDSRTIMFAASGACGVCAMLAAYGHFPIRKQALQKLAALLLGLIVAAVLLFGFEHMMTLINAVGNARAETTVESTAPTQTAKLIGTATAAEAPPVAQATEAPQAAMPEEKQPEARGLLEGVTTLTGRTDIWKSAFIYIRQNPSVLLTGATDAEVARIPGRLSNATVYHLHDVWLEILLLGGIPGFLLYLLLIVKVLIGDWRLLKSKQTPLYLRFLAVATLAMIANSLTEIYPGVAGNVMDIMFFILAGAVVRKGEELKAKA